MAMLKRFPVTHESVFPAHAFLIGDVEAVLDFKAGKRADGSRPQQVDQDSGLPLWSVQVLDADAEAGKKEKTVVVKIAAPHQPVPPANDGPFPFVPVEFVGLTALPYADESGQRVEDGKIVGRARVAWSFKADGMVAPGKAPKAGGPSSSSSAAGSAAGAEKAA